MVLAGQLFLENIFGILRFHPCLLVVVALSIELQQISAIVSSAPYGFQKMDAILAVSVDIHRQKDNQIDTVACIAQNTNL